MKADLKKAVDLLFEGEYTCVLCKDDELITSTVRGVKPLIDWLNSKTELEGFCAADKVVGKAATFLYVLLNVDSVYAPVMSKGAIDILSRYGIEPFYDLSVEAIRNRSDTDICPMEKTVQDINDPIIALEKIKQRLELMTSTESANH